MNYITTVKRDINTWNRLTGNKVTLSKWLDWKWHIRNRVNNPEKLLSILSLDKETQNQLIEVSKHFILSVTPFQLVLVQQLINSGRKTEAKSLSSVFLPNIAEISPSKTGTIDGLGEDNTTHFNYISQLYQDRALLFVTDTCPLYCRYCFRRRKVIHPTGKKQNKTETILQRNHLENAAKYIEEHPQIRDVILSGGEPLFLYDEQIELIIKRLRKIKHVDIIRIDTKMPTVIPQRITNKLIKMLRKYHPIFITLHAVHPAEFENAEVRNACTKLIDAGIPLGTYTPLLKGINNDRETLKKLFWELLKLRIRPYYLVHFVPTIWTEHFRIPLHESLNLIAGLHLEISGLALPSLKIYVPKEGKIPITSQIIEGPSIKGNKRVYTFIVPMPSGNPKKILYEEPIQ